MAYISSRPVHRKLDEDGIIAGWSPGVELYSAIVAVPNAKAPATDPHAIYKGLALANDGLRDLLYAANFASGKIEVYDVNFVPVTGRAASSIAICPADFLFSTSRTSAERCT